MNGVLNMKSDFKKIFRKRILPTVLAVLALSVCSITAFAVGEDDSQTPDPQPDPVVTEYVPVETEPQYTEPIYTEPVYTEAPTTEYVEPETEEPTTEYVQPETEAQKQEETQYQNQYVETQATDSTEFQAPTIAKTVSEKKVFHKLHGGNCFVDLRRSWSSCNCGCNDQHKSRCKKKNKVTALNV